MTQIAHIPPRPIAGFREIAEGYDAALVDIWGVIHNGVEPYHAAVEACRRFRAERGPVVLLSNSPRRSVDIPAQFAQVGVQEDCYDGIVTSGDATRAVLAARAPGPALAIGPERDRGIYAGLDLTFAPLEEAAFISCTGLYDDATEGPEDYAALLRAARARNLDMVCANPDIIVERGGQRIYCAGAIAQAYEECGGNVILCGKPHAPIYELARAELARLKPGLDRIIAVGDGPGTDVRGAAGQGLDCFFISRGAFAQEIDAAGGGGDAVASVLASYETSAAFAAPALAW